MNVALCRAALVPSLFVLALSIASILQAQTESPPAKDKAPAKALEFDARPVDLYRPPLQENTLVLWLGPAVILGIGLLAFGLIIIRRSRKAEKE